MWAADALGVSPDIICAAKGLGSGVPIGAIIAREAFMAWPQVRCCLGAAVSARRRAAAALALRR